MRAAFLDAERYRVQLEGFERSNPGDRFGIFIIPHPRVQIRMIAHDGQGTGWEHVSVSLLVRDQRGDIRHMLPDWNVMRTAKRMFWEDEECVVEFHPPESVYVNSNEYVLHLWRKVGVNLETPPIHLV